MLNISKSAVALAVSLPVCGVSLAADWPPVLDQGNPFKESREGRTIERFTHGARMEWGYPDEEAWAYPPPEELSAHDLGPEPQHLNSFYVVAPLKPRARAPLVVVLHSANRTAFVYLGYQFLETGNRRYDDPGNVSMRVPDDCYGLFLNSRNDEWWGWSQAQRDRAKYETEPTPGEKRILDTIDWAAKKYKTDRNRTYLCGVSMGGCGTLGLGLAHGDIFAAVMTWACAGTEYAAYLRGFPPPLADQASDDEKAAWTRQISGVGRPDPPIVLDITSQADDWSKTQDVLLLAARAGRLPLVVGWGPFGHSEFRLDIVKYPLSAVALDFPWREIRRNHAYPVFTHATSDQRAPWLNPPEEFDETGQINAYFRWQVERDRRTRFSMRLWVANPNVTNAPPMPEAITADITLRRLQKFKVKPGSTYAWQISSDGCKIASGTVQPDEANLLTIPQVTLTAIPAKLSLNPER